MTDLPERLRLRADTAANWTALNPVLGVNEPARETDSGKFKIGDGVTPWNDLPAFLDETSLAATLVPRAELDDPASDARTALNAAYVGVGAGGVRTVALGNSIEDGSGTHAANIWQGRSYVTQMGIQSLGRIRLVHNGGRSGDTTAQMLARWDASVTPFAPKLLLLGSAENDLKTLTPADSLAGVDALVQRARQVGALPVVHTCVPRGTQVSLADIVDFNVRLLRYAADNGVPLLDFYSWLASEADGTLYANSDYTDDGTHTTSLGANYIASKALAVLLPYLPPAAVDLTRSANDPLNLFVNGLFTADTNSDGVPDGWGSGGAAGIVRSLVSIPGVPGKMLQLENVSAATRSYNSQVVAAGPSTFQVGDVLRLSYRLQADQEAAAYDGFYAIFTGSTEPVVWTNQAAQGVVDGVGGYEFTVPIGTTSIGFYMSTLPGAGVVRYGQATLRNLTKMGIAGHPADQPASA